MGPGSGHLALQGADRSRLGESIGLVILPSPQSYYGLEAVMSGWIGPIWVVVTITLLAIFVFNPKETEFSDQTNGSLEAYLAENVARKDEMAALMESAPLVTLAYVNLLSARRLPCLMQEMAQQSSGVPSTKQPENYVVTKLLSRMERQCVVYTQMEKTATHFFSNLIKSREFQDYYVFTLFEAADDPYSWSEKEIGIFPSLTDCQRFERALHDLDVTTRKCQMRTIPPQPPAPPTPGFSPQVGGRGGQALSPTIGQKTAKQFEKLPPEQFAALDLGTLANITMAVVNKEITLSPEQRQALFDALGARNGSDLSFICKDAISRGDSGGTFIFC